MNFSQLFFKREYEALSGEKKSSIGIFSGVMFLTLLSLAFSLGSIDELSVRMDNPYTNWVNLELGRKSYRDSFPNLLKTLKKDSALSKEYGLREVIPYRISVNKFPNNEKPHKVYDRLGRVISHDDPILDNILDLESENLKFTLKKDPKSFFLNNCGVIVTKDFLEGLGYLNDFKNHKRVAILSGINTFYFDIVAIVEQLPDKCGFAMSPCLYHYTTTNALDDKLKAAFVGGELQNFREFYFLSRKISNDSVYNIVQEQLKSFKPERLIVKNFNLLKNDSTRLNTLFFPINNELELPDYDEWKAFLKGNGFMPYNRYSCIIDSSIMQVNNPDQVAFSFIELSKLRTFESYLNKRFDMKLEMTQVEEKENFGLVSRLTFIISSALFGFGLLSIVLLSFFKLSSHLNSIKENLGTFKAFGLKDNLLQQIYSKVILRFLLVGCLVALFLTILFGLVFNQFSHKVVFDVFNGWLYLALGIIFLANLVMSYFLIQKLLKDTPGNLIYGR